MFFLGLDIGSRTTKLVVIDKDKNIVFSNIIDTVRTARYSFDIIFKSIPDNIRSHITYSIVTGYGRVGVSDLFDDTITEITAHFKGVLFYYPDISTIIDIGGQDSKVLSIRNGILVDFLMNDRCAAGTGRFIEVMLSRLEISLETFADLDIAKLDFIELNATCTVFAESEIISHMAMGTEPEILSASVARMVALNVFFMMKRLNYQLPIVMTGGVSRLKPVVYFIESFANSNIIVPKDAQLFGALGASLVARERFLSL